jgi:beta-lactamase superfamily II metal-dependent hydrolase
MASFTRLAIVAATLCCAATLTAADSLDIYFIDVEGGQATLIATPTGESLLVDTGYGGNDDRDATRVMAAVRAAGLKQIDYLLITHFHPDHDGGVGALAKQIPIHTFIDHGGFDPVALKDESSAVIAAYDAYVAVRATHKHLQPKPGDRLPLKGVDLIFVSAAKATIAKAVAGSARPTPGCPSPAPAANETLENPRSTGFHLRFGEFRFIDLGDLTGPPLFSLVCPANKLGRIDAYLLPHHGGSDVAHPSLIAALKPRVAIINNGQIKGGQTPTLDMLHAANGLEDVWQLHQSHNDGVKNFDQATIANLDETTGHWLKLSASADGSFTMTNGRTNVTKQYAKAATPAR